MTLYCTKKVVAVGGGHGLGRMLAALKDFGENATGIVATTDNGGSTGRTVSYTHLRAHETN